jgi:hypothetical protein
MISIFAGFASERMFQRWRPTGSGRVTVLRADQFPEASLLTRAIIRLL